jgi:LacI family transcriptional regulator
VRLIEVAARARVSPSTASKALNGRDGMRPDTRDRVLRAAEELGFRPNAIARGLLSGTTCAVGLLTTDNFGRFSIPILLGAEKALSSGNMAVLLCNSQGEPAREERYLQALVDRRVDGLIVTGRRTEDRPPVRRLPIPVVYAFAPSSDPADCSVVVDQAGGARIAVRHLRDCGRHRIAHITGPRRHRAARSRAQAATRALARADLRLQGEVAYGEWSEMWGRRAAETLLASHPRIDGIFCGSDQVARGVVDALTAQGRRVPDDVAVVGFDNWPVMAEASRPPLTTVDMNVEHLGRVAATKLLAAIEGDEDPGLHRLACSLVVRESTAGETA